MFNWNAPNGDELHETALEYVKNIHLFDGRRADRCISRWGLESRVPLLDPEFIRAYWSIPASMRHPNFANIIHDMSLLRSLGVKLVVVHGARPQIEERMAQRGIERNIEKNIRVTDAQTLVAVKDATGSLRLHIEALLSTGLVNSPMHGSQIRVSTGNFVIAKPMGG